VTECNHYLEESGECLNCGENIVDENKMLHAAVGVLVKYYLPDNYFTSTAIANAWANAGFNEQKRSEFFKKYDSLKK